MALPTFFGTVMKNRILSPAWLIPACGALMLLSACQEGDKAQDVRQPKSAQAALLGEYLSPATFENPYGHIPAQCYIETSAGRQNACLFCHTDGLAKDAFGNNNPQVDLNPRGNLQLIYSFAPLSRFVANPSINPWENTLFPEKLRAAVLKLDPDFARWDMRAYIREDNWGAAFARRPGDPRAWDPQVSDPLRLFPGLDPADLPAHADGFVRSGNPAHGLFQDARGWLTGWRAVNFMPYGIFTPMTGSVSGIYIRLPKAFMQDGTGQYSLEVYHANLELLRRAIQDRLGSADPVRYYGRAGDEPVRRGLYPVGTEFAHPLHYVDVDADGGDPSVSPFPGTRSRRVKEIRYMYKRLAFDPAAPIQGGKEEDAPVYVGAREGWIDNAAGWIVAGFIEDAKGGLRPQTPGELMQCLGCHSGLYGNEPAQFSSGVGNTVDSTWAFPRQLKGEAGWREMDYLGYRRDKGAGDGDTPGSSRIAEPLNRRAGVGEFRYFLDHVVGSSLYGEMPSAVDTHLARLIRRDADYRADWPKLEFASAESLNAAQSQRSELMREFTRRGAYRDADGRVKGVFLYPPKQDALAGAGRYRQVVVTQRYSRGKDVFVETPFTLRYYRDARNGFTHLDGRIAYRPGEVITDRPVNRAEGVDWGAGTTSTLIDPRGNNYDSQYSPLID